jgi:hypothetical protein
MKKLILLVAFCLAMCSFAFAQSKFPELDKIKQIKLLESTREDVKRLFDEYAEDFDDDAEEDIEDDAVSTENVFIRFFYSSGNCLSDENNEWNVLKGKVTEITVSFEGKSVKPQNLRVDLSKLERIKIYENDDDEDDDLIYYDQEKGISYEISEGEINRIKFIPAEKNYPTLCNNENVRRFHSDKNWFVNKLKQRPKIREYMVFANVTELNLSKNQITADCSAEDLSKINSDNNHFKIKVETKAESADPTDVFTYNYMISGGKITGSGANVTWDLTGVKPEKYTITAAVDNGCGVCGMTKTETVEVKDYPDCQEKPK